jgi:hypothetical protein
MFEPNGRTGDGVQFRHECREVFVGAPALALIHPQDVLSPLVSQQGVETALDSCESALMLLSEHTSPRLGQCRVLCVATILLLLLPK